MLQRQGTASRPQDSIHQAPPSPTRADVNPANVVSASKAGIIQLTRRDDAPVIARARRQVGRNLPQPDVRSVAW